MPNDASLPNASERPITDDRDTWRAYWRTQEMPWRTEPEISPERQAYFAERRAITPDIEQGIYPFNDIEPKLTRADIEWLLATHDGGRGPVVWKDEQDKPDGEHRDGLDLRGANLSKVNLSGLPLTRLHGGLSFDEMHFKSATGREQAAIHLEGADLRRAQLQEAFLSRAQLAGADFSEAQLAGANLHRAQLAGRISAGRCWRGRACVWLCSIAPLL